MSDDLKPCPFCGGEAELKDGLYSEDGMHDQKWSVCCKRCGATVSRAPFYGKGNYFWGKASEGCELMREAVASLWNARAESTCHMVPMWEEPDANGYMTCKCDACGWMADYAADSEPSGWCASCGAKVVCDG